MDDAVDAVVDFLKFAAGGYEGGPDAVVDREVPERVQKAATHLHEGRVEFLHGVTCGGEGFPVVGGVVVQGFFQLKQGCVEFPFLVQQVVELVADGQREGVMLQFFRRFPGAGDKEAQLVRVVTRKVAGNGFRPELAVVRPEGFHQDVPDAFFLFSGDFRGLGGAVEVLKGCLSDLVA